MREDHQIRLVASADELSAAAARLFVTCAGEAVSSRGRFVVALAGGSTPEAMYRRLAEDSASRDAVAWPQVHVFWGDERHVPPTDEASNYRMADDALLQHVPIPSGQIHRIETEGRDAADVAQAYEATLRTALSATPDDWPIFDLVLLGMGEDGHTASLFPGSSALSDTSHVVAAPFVEKLQAFRITLTPPVLCHARAVAVLVSGVRKAKVLRETLEGPFLPDLYPIQLLRHARGMVTWIVDAEAASALTTGRPSWANRVSHPKEES